MKCRVAFLLFFIGNYLISFGQYKLTLEKLPEAINSPLYDEIAPILSYDGQTMYFTRVGHPDFDKTLEVGGKNLFLSLSSVQYDTYLAKVYSKLSGSRINNAIRSSYNQDVWIAEFEKNAFQTLTHPGPPLNNALPNSICALTPDAGTFLVLNQFLPGGGMDQGFSIIRKKGAEWLFPEPVSIENFYTT